MARPAKPAADTGRRTENDGYKNERHHRLEDQCSRQVVLIKITGSKTVLPQSVRGDLIVGFAGGDQVKNTCAEHRTHNLCAGIADERARRHASRGHHSQRHGGVEMRPRNGAQPVGCRHDRQAKCQADARQSNIGAGNDRGTTA